MPTDAQTPLEVRPAPPEPTRLNRRAGVAAFMVLGLLMAAIVYGVSTRQGVNMRGKEEQTRAESATNAGREIASRIGEGNLTERPTDRESRPGCQAPRRRQRPLTDHRRRQGQLRRAHQVARLGRLSPARREVHSADQRRRLFQQHRAGCCPPWRWSSMPAWRLVRAPRLPPASAPLATFPWALVLVRPGRPPVPSPQ